MDTLDTDRIRVANRLQYLADDMANEAAQPIWADTRIGREFAVTANTLRYLARRALQRTEDLAVLDAYVTAGIVTHARIVDARHLLDHIIPNEEKP